MKSSAARLAFAGALGIGLVPVAGAAKPFNACRTSTNAAYDSCTAGAQSDKALAVGKCNNLLDSGAVKACRAQADADVKDAASFARASENPASERAAGSGPRRTVR